MHPLIGLSALAAFKLIRSHLYPSNVSLFANGGSCTNGKIGFRDGASRASAVIGFG